MAAIPGPTVRQRQLSMRLRAIRLEKNLSVEAVAKELECSQSKISRLETASRRPNPRDVRDLCRFYGLDDVVSAELVELAREAKEPGWRKEYPEVRLGLESHRLGPYLDLERSAAAITAFATFYVPALMQTTDYAAAVIKGIVPTLDSEVLKERVDVRIRRQILFGREGAPTYRAFIDEAVLHRPTGGSEVMAAQIDKILELEKEGKVIVQIVPFEVGVVPAQDSNFVLLEFAEPELSPVVFIESLQNSQILEKEADIKRYRETIDYLRDSALTPRDSKARLTQISKTFSTVPSSN